MRLLSYVGRYAQARDVGQSYVEQLETCARVFEQTVGRRVRIDQIDADTVNLFLRRQKDAGIADETRASRRRMILTLWRDAWRRGILPPPNGAIAPVKIRDRLPKSWTIEQVRHLLAAVDRLPGIVSDRLPVDRALYWGAYVPIAWDTGLRGCDIRDMERDDIHPDRTVYLVQDKTGRRARVRLRAKTVERIDRSLDALPRQKICGLWAGIRDWRRQIARIVQDACLPGSIGWLRHSSGTDCELHNPGRGHEHLNNTRTVFLRHYFDDSRAVYDRPTPEPLE